MIGGAETFLVAITVTLRTLLRIRFLLSDGSALKVRRALWVVSGWSSAPASCSSIWCASAVAR
jgi:hypothetical protein